MLLAHLDVVPAEITPAARWTHPPFAGEIADGFVWGRGALDDKIAAVSLLEAAEHLLATGFKPRRTIYLAFGHDEEVGGRQGAARIAAALGGRGVRAELVLDEGLAITRGLLGGIDRPVALVGVAEKGFADVAVTAQVTGGHSSMPPRARRSACSPAPSPRSRPTPCRPGSTAWRARCSEYLAPEMAFGRRVLMANLWLLAPVGRARALRRALDQRAGPHDPRADDARRQRSIQRAARARQRDGERADPARRHGR